MSPREDRCDLSQPVPASFLAHAPALAREFGQPEQRD
jgi:hypothetical protein